MRPSQRYWPYRRRASPGSSACLKSRSYPRAWREEKKREWEDRIARSSTRTRSRRSVGRSTEKALQGRGRREVSERRRGRANRKRSASFAIAADRHQGSGEGRRGLGEGARRRSRRTEDSLNMDRLLRAGWGVENRKQGTWAELYGCDLTCMKLNSTLGFKLIKAHFTLRHER